MSLRYQLDLIGLLKFVFVAHAIGKSIQTSLDYKDTIL
jgi:hypothetical protein